MTTTENTDLNRFNAWLIERKYPLPRCPICDSHSWLLARDIVQLEQYRPIDNGVYPVAKVHCKTCGYTMFFDAVVVGLVKGREE